jgi:hypothetical protein
MNKRVEFWGDIFKGIGLGLNFGYYDNIIIIMGTFLCFSFNIEVNLKKK